MLKQLLNVIYATKMHGIRGIEMVVWFLVLGEMRTALLGGTVRHRASSCLAPCKYLNMDNTCIYEPS